MSDKRSMGAAMEVWLLKMACVLVATLCLLPCASAQVSGGGGVLTLDEALQLAKSNNRDLKEFGFDVSKQREAVGEAKTHLYPRLDTSVLAAQLLAPIDFTVQKGQFGTFPGTGPIPGSSTDLHTPARPIAIASVTATQPLTQLIRIHLFVAEQRLKVSCPWTNVNRS
jgi:Outer membrane efflux protein